MKIAGLEFVNHRYPLDEATLKPGPEFLEDRAVGKMNVSMGLVPVLDVVEPDGRTFSLGQSHSIKRYIARRHGLMGKNDEEAVVIDELVEHVRDATRLTGLQHLFLKFGHVRLSLGSIEQPWVAWAFSTGPWSAISAVVRTPGESLDALTTAPPLSCSALLPYALTTIRSIPAAGS